MRWEKVDDGWYILFQNDTETPNESSFAAVCLEDCIPPWCVYLEEDMPPGDAQFRSKKTAKAWAERKLRDALKAAPTPAPNPANNEEHSMLTMNSAVTTEYWVIKVGNRYFGPLAAAPLEKNRALACVYTSRPAAAGAAKRLREMGHDCRLVRIRSYKRSELIRLIRAWAPIVDVAKRYVLGQATLIELAEIVRKLSAEMSP